MGREVRYEISFVPANSRYVVRTSRVYSASRITLTYAFGWDALEADRSVAAATDTLAHETFHLTRSLFRVQEALRDEESLAYKIGRCAQFSATGWLRLRDMQNDVLTSNGPYENVAISASAEHESALELAKYFDKTDVVRRGTPLGDALQADCDQSIHHAYRTDTRPRLPARKN